MFKRIINWNIFKVNPFEALAPIVWSKREINPKLEKIKGEIILLRTIYAIVIFISCIVSFLSLFDLGTIKWLKIIIGIIQIITFFVFIIDYVLHMLTYQYASDKSYLRVPFVHLRYFFSFNSFVIICCLLASMHVVEHFGAISPDLKNFLSNIKGLNVFRIIRLFMVLTLFGPFQVITQVFATQKKVLTSVFILIIVLIVLFALVIWNNEITFLEEQQKEFLDAKIQAQFTSEQINSPEWAKQIEDFKTTIINSSDYQALSSGYITDFWTSIYFTTITLTTIGYGDYAPHAPVSRMIVSFIALMAIAIIAIPSGVIAGAFLTEMQNRAKTQQEQKKINKPKKILNMIEKKAEKSEEYDKTR
ncbi:potassium channel family protein [Mycoplasmopsis glycophila]|uniref:Ion channel n=1 Tax=Mycoplasmopsis glycophila TaxID=171285 RepID=A0A449AUV2_9BACT|nr:potassium channel family protein [Mycoplasmopsis glycophila]VEU70252.1 Ion channel [Mycoplasmopsis glycophila]